MSDDAIPTIARVECRSEGRADERPVAVVVGSHRLEIVHVLDQAMITTGEAGESVRHRYWVELDHSMGRDVGRGAPVDAVERGEGLRQPLPGNSPQ